MRRRTQSPGTIVAHVRAARPTVIDATIALGSMPQGVLRMFAQWVRAAAQPHPEMIDFNMAFRWQGKCNT